MNPTSIRTFPALAALLLSAAPLFAQNLPGPIPPPTKRCPGNAKSGSIDWSVEVGHAYFPKSTSLTLLAGISREGDGSLPSFQELLGRAYSGEPLQRSGLVMLLSQPRITAATFDPASLFCDTLPQCQVIYKNSVNGFGKYMNQIVTDDDFALLDYLPAPDSGYRLRVWKKADLTLTFANGIYTGNFDAVTALDDVTMKRPSANAGDNTLIYTRRETTGISGSRVITKQFVQTPDASGKPASVVTTTYAGADTTAPILEQENITYSNRGAREWDYTLTREVRTAPVSASGTIGSPLVLTASTQEVYADFTPSSSYPGGSDTGGAVGMKRLLSKTEAFGVTGQTSPTATYTYVNNPANTTVHGRLQTSQYADGRWESYDYLMSPTSPAPVITRYSSWKDVPATDLAHARKEVTQIDTTNGAVTETYIADTLVSKTRTMLAYSASATDTITSEQIWDGSSWHNKTVTGYYSESPSIPAISQGRIHWVENGDGTASTYSYSNGSVANTTVVTKRVGAGDRNCITSGTETTTTYNVSNNAISEITKDIASGLQLTEWDTDLSYNGGFDPQGRPIKKIYDGDTNDYTIEQYECCGLALSRDRNGSSTHYYRDGLKRVYKTETQLTPGAPTITDTTAVAGLTATRNRTISNNSQFLGSTTVSLDGLTKTKVSPSVSSTNPDDRPVTTSMVANTSTGSVTTTTLPDLSTRIQATYLDGQPKSITGTSVAAAYCYDYNPHALNGGGLATTTILGDPNSLSKTTVYYDLLGRPFLTETPTNDPAHPAVSLNAYYPPAATAGSRDKLASVTDPDHVTVSYGYDVEGRQSTTTKTVPTASGNATLVTTTTRNVVANATVKGVNLGTCHHTTSSVASTNVNLVTTGETFTTPDGLVTATRSFGREELKTIARPDASGIATTTTIKADGTQTIATSQYGLPAYTQLKDKNGILLQTVSQIYDDLQRPYTLTTVTKDSVGNTVTLTTTTYSNFTEAGRPLTTTDAANRPTSVVLDSMGRVRTKTLPDNSVTHTTYWPNGLVKASYGSQTYPAVKLYNNLGLIRELRTFRSGDLTLAPDETTTGYDPTTWYYDPAGRLFQKLDASGKGNTYIYTLGGRLFTRTNARNIATTYFHTLGYLTGVTYSDNTTPNVTYTYDALGRSDTVTQDRQCRISYGYDPNKLTLYSETVSYDTAHSGTWDFARTIIHNRDEILREQGFALNNGNTLENQSVYGYDDAGRLNTVTGLASCLFTYAYEPAAPQLIHSVTGPAHTVTNTWDLPKQALLTKQNQAGQTLVSGFDYSAVNGGINSLGKRGGVATGGSAFAASHTTAWGYDALGQVISATTSDSSADRAYQYDAIGNRKKSASSLTLPTDDNYTANALNQYSGITTDSVTATPAYDDDGNATAYPLPVNPCANATLTWDAENRLTSATVNGITTTYAYDAKSRRIAKTYTINNQQSTVSYLYDGWNVVAEYSRSVGVPPTLFKTYLWGVDLSGSLQGAGGVGGLLSVSQISNPQIANYYPTYDGNGNISEYLTTSGAIAAHLEYDAFGNTTVNTDTGNLFTYRFSTKPSDIETSLYYYGYRFYDPVTGRWLSKDPIAERGGLDLYEMGGNNITSSIDVLGLSMNPAATLGEATGLAAGGATAADIVEALEGAISLTAAEALVAEAALKKECDELARKVADANEDPNLKRCQCDDSDADLALKAIAWDALASARWDQNQKCTKYLKTPKEIETHIQKQREAYDNWIRCLTILSGR